MARPGLSYEEVATAAEKIVNEGFKPTIQRIRVALGNRGSTTTISRHLKNWKAAPKKLNLTGESNGAETTQTTTPVSGAMPDPFTYPNNQQQEHFGQVRSPDMTPTEYQAESLQGLDKEQLKVKVLQLETLLLKEQSRRESAEAMARDLRDYADILRGEVGRRMDDMERSFQRTIDELKAETRQLKANATDDLKFYRDALEKANAKITELLEKK